MRRRRPVADTPEGLSPVPSGLPADDSRGTRKRLALWDRIKFLILLTIIWWVLVWSEMASFTGVITFREALVTEARTGAWVFVLLGLEAIRQVHYLISEHWAGYHRFWTVSSSAASSVSLTAGCRVGPDSGSGGCSWSSCGSP